MQPTVEGTGRIADYIHLSDIFEVDDGEMLTASYPTKRDFEKFNRQQ